MPVVSQIDLCQCGLMEMTVTIGTPSENDRFLSALREVLSAGR
jgi:histidinol-phosphate/aromatic aminotransferase/cobyric acid decarboxylase-like protein